MIKKYFLTRRQWGVELEKLLRKHSTELHEYYSKKMVQKVLTAKDSVIVEKDSEIKLLEEELKDKKNEIRYLKKADLETEKLRNELQAKITHMDYQKKLLEEFGKQIDIRTGMMDSAIRNSEKLHKKEVKDI